MLSGELDRSEESVGLEGLDALYRGRIGVKWTLLVLSVR